METSELNSSDVNIIISEQKNFFNTNKTLNISFRKKALLKLKKGIEKYQQDITDALKKDLNKSEFETYITETGLVLHSINNALKNINKWAKPKRVSTPMYLFPAKEYIMYEPFGTVLIIAPYNYPFQLIIEPLIGAIAAGNCAVLKLSELTPNVSRVLMNMITELFDKNYIQAVDGGVETNKALSAAPFDYIFFTGSTRVGKLIMKSASYNLTPVTLELGGKSPVIVDKSVNIPICARRIIWGKTLNAGQTCVAPDHMFIHESIKKEFISEMIKSIKEFYGDDPYKSNDFARIINENHFDRIQSILTKDSKMIIHGGNCIRESLYIEPTLIDVNSNDAASMEEEIFGPILPIITYSNLQDVITLIKNQPKPLALYIFSEDKAVTQKLVSQISSGGVCVNDTILHMVSPNLPFGGVGNSGMGYYHGKYSFDTFSHKKSISYKGSKLKSSLIFPPYTDKKLSFIKKVFK